MNLWQPTLSTDIEISIGKPVPIPDLNIVLRKYKCKRDEYRKKLYNSGD
jgi:hypothetical protein